MANDRFTVKWGGEEIEAAARSASGLFAITYVTDRKDCGEFTLRALFCQRWVENLLARKCLNPPHYCYSRVLILKLQGAILISAPLRLGRCMFFASTYSLRYCLQPTKSTLPVDILSKTGNWKSDLWPFLQSWSWLELDEQCCFTGQRCPKEGLRTLQAFCFN